MDTRLLPLLVAALGMGVSIVNYPLFWFDFLSFLSKTADLVWRVGSGILIAFSAVMFIVVNFLYLLSRPLFLFAVAEVLSNASLFIVTWTFFFSGLYLHASLGFICKFEVIYHHWLSKSNHIFHVFPSFVKYFALICLYVLCSQDSYECILL